MPAAIPETIKSRVIIQWLQGLSRDAIACDNKISTGAVSNIVNDWTNTLGKYEADALRELAKSLKIAGLYPAQCAIGFRTMKILSEHGINGEAAEHFISEIYKKCENLGATSSKIVTYIEDLTKFSDQIRLPEIEDYISQQAVKKRELENKLQELKDQIYTLEEQKSELEKSRDLALEQKRKATEEMKSYFDAKQELDKHKISITEDVPKFAKSVRGIAEYGYEPKKVIAEFEDIRYLARKREALEIGTDEMQKNLAKLKQQDYSLRNAINLHSENLSVYNELANIGFGSSELIRLLRTILVIMNSNGIDHWLAVYKFFNDIETQYDAKLGRIF
jgi:DNA repair exonuclease SbcCD ATPase subunit